MEGSKLSNTANHTADKMALAGFLTTRNNRAKMVRATVLNQRKPKDETNRYGHIVNFSLNVVNSWLGDIHILTPAAAHTKGMFLSNYVCYYNSFLMTDGDEDSVYLLMSSNEAQSKGVSPAEFCMPSSAPTDNRYSTASRELVEAAS